MTVTDQPTTSAQESLDRRRALKEVKARLTAISGTLSDSRIDASELRKDVEELNAITSRITWLADITTRPPLQGD
jgi:hypothetical protein